MINVMNIFKRNATIIPFKTSKGDDNCIHDPNELFIEMCIEDGIKSLLCISQKSLVPIECIDTRLIGIVKDDVIHDIINEVNKYEDNV